MNDPSDTVELGLSGTSPVASDSSPSHIGRYRVERTLGQGGFGVVHLAHDDQLQRLVAIKVLHRKLVDRPENAEAYLIEARIVAKLDHPNIVPVHDVGSTEQFPCFVVSKYIDGTDLAARLKQSRLSRHDAVELAATVAEALHHAHKQGLVHRDIKPENILLDKSDRPFVADFGLALREQDVGKGPRFAGTPAYMSPEQARGEGHRVDGRSDIFSLGVVLYESLTGRRPFRGNSRQELLEQITDIEAKPPRQIDDDIPKELERICLRALSKRASDRYSIARDMADDLRHFLASAPAEEKVALTGKGRNETDVDTPLPTPAPTPSDQQAIKIVPKGLRSFDAADADFFLELLPGPRDRGGLPDSVRFWKSRIETIDRDGTFSVGLIYGPSGCGKSSLVNAGLLPRLAKSVAAVCIEATGEETEARLLKGLRRRVPDLPSNLELIESLAALRQGTFLESGQTVLLVLDQFEQWLHAHGNGANACLVQALRQCDGGRLKCVVMVRDDFWLAVSRFMKALEVEILEGRNSALVDLFDPIHARKVLGAFGRAYGRLPDNLGRCSREQDSFLDQAVAGLSQDGKVISVRLALFAEMMKGRPWTPAALKEVGGTEGVGVTFLEETFAASTAPPRHRVHQKAAEAVLTALLPEAGTDIKGNMRPRQELLAASGYAGRPNDFDELIRILDAELRLITPTDPEGQQEADPSLAQSHANCYQLTHDYLVPSLRDWLTRKQKETRRGRAELLLADRAAVWNARPENRQLPSLRQWLGIRWLTRKKNWTPQQRRMMRKAGRVHAARGTVAALLVAVATVAGLTVRDHVVEQQKATAAAGLVQGLLNADIAQVPAIISQLAEYRPWADPLLREENEKAAANSPRKLHASLALLQLDDITVDDLEPPRREGRQEERLLPVDATLVDYLCARLLDAEPNEVPVIRDALDLHKVGLLERLWTVVESPPKGKESQRLRAAAALATYDPKSGKWAKAQAAVGNDLVAVPAVYLTSWMESLRPARTTLCSQLSAVYRDASRRETERSLATDILADYAADSPLVLADLLMDADEKQFAVIYPKFKALGDRGLPVLIAEIDKSLPPDLPSADERRETLAKRQANAGVALLKMNQPAKVWPLLKAPHPGPLPKGEGEWDPRARSYLIHRLGPLGADAAAIVKRLDEEPDITIRRALVLSLGEFGEAALPAAARQALLPKLQTIYRTDADPGLHAAAEWLLRRWEQEAWLKQVNERWAKDTEQRDMRLDGIEQLLQKTSRAASAPGSPPGVSPQWYVNVQGQTMIVMPGPVEFMMGSPKSEVGRSDDEIQHNRRIGRTFALAAKAVTLEQYRQFEKDYQLPEVYTRLPDLSVIGIDWFRAARYCNWLSQQEGVPEEEWCYETEPNGQTRPNVNVVKLRANYLSLGGYRLPTEAEMEYATRAGSIVARYFGETDELLPLYGWHLKNSEEKTWPVGRLKPNDLGLFDMHGNVWCWCQETHSGYPAEKGAAAVEDKEDALEIDRTVSRVLRGGSFAVQAASVRSADRNYSVPTDRSYSVGFRAARTLPLGSLTALPPPAEGGSTKN